MEIETHKNVKGEKKRKCCSCSAEGAFRHRDNNLNSKSCLNGRLIHLTYLSYHHCRRLVHFE